MGDRANVLVTDQYGQHVFLYTHRGGYNLPRVVQRALARHERWNDSAYLTRIVFSEMVKHDIDGSTGYGISNMIPDNEHLIIWLDSGRRTVSYITEKAALDPNPNPKEAVREWSMKEFSEAPEAEIMHPWDE